MSLPTRIVFDAEVDDKGKLSIVNAMIVRSRLAKWAGKHVSVVITRYVKSKTTAQLGYLFGCVLPIWAEHCGYEIDEMRDEIEMAYMPRRTVVCRLTGEESQERPRLSKATSEEVSQLLDRSLREAASQGVYIPSPEDYYKGAAL